MSYKGNKGWKKGLGRPFTVGMIEDRSVKVTETGCWLWIGRVSTQGYGRLKLMNKDVGAHRASWIAHFGPIADGVSILHKCDTRCCVNPSHLYGGDHKQNMRDMASRGRASRTPGDTHVCAKLKEIDAISILESGEMHKVLAARYGISKSTVSNIKTGKNWKHLVRKQPL